MKIIKIDAIWCSSCLIMKSRFNEIIKDYDIKVLEYDYDLDTDKYTKYNIGDVLPVYIKFNDELEIKRLIGEHSKKEIINFIEG